MARTFKKEPKLPLKARRVQNGRVSWDFKHSRFNSAAKVRMIRSTAKIYSGGRVHITRAKWALICVNLVLIRSTKLDNLFWVSLSPFVFYLVVFLLLFSFSFLFLFKKRGGVLKNHRI